MMRRSTYSSSATLEGSSSSARWNHAYIARALFSCSMPLGVKRSPLLSVRGIEVAMVCPWLLRFPWE